MRQHGIRILAVSACFVLSSCATILTGTTDDIIFESDPPGARILIDGIDYGTTPATVTVQRPGLNDKHVTLQLDGYEDRVFVLQKEFNYVSILNFAGIVGWGVDIATGAMMKYSPMRYDMELRSPRSSMRLDAIPRDASGAFLIPSGLESVLVSDPESGATYLFE